VILYNAAYNIPKMIKFTCLIMILQ